MLILLNKDIFLILLIKAIQNLFQRQSFREQWEVKKPCIKYLLLLPESLLQIKWKIKPSFKIYIFLKFNTGTFKFKKKYDISQSNDTFFFFFLILENRSINLI